MPKKTSKTEDTLNAVEYRIFNLPGHGRVRAPVTMTQETLMEAMQAADPEDVP